MLSIIPEPSLLSWLLHEQSLTEKLRNACGDAQLEVLAQRWQLPDHWDQSVLKLGSVDNSDLADKPQDVGLGIMNYQQPLDSASVMHREILRRAFDAPCWYARTILPLTTFNANATLFARLKTEPLGHLIFNGTQIQRASLQHYCISPASEEYSWLNESMHQGAEKLWVRLSEFFVNARDSFFLVEILLPGLSRYLS